MRQRVPRAVWLIAGLVAALLVIPAAASANSFPGNGDSTVTDNDLHTYCYTSGFTTDRSVASYAMWVLEAPPTWRRCSRRARRTCAYEETDVWWWEIDHPAGTRGIRDCRDPNPVTICIASDVELDFDELDDGPNDTSDDDWEDRRKTAVHEVGHSIGLGHDTISTMRQGEIPDTSLTWRRYSAHDLVHINGDVLRRVIRCAEHSRCPRSAAARARRRLRR